MRMRRSRSLQRAGRVSRTRDGDHLRDELGLSGRGLPGGQVAEAAAAEQVVPELGRDDAGQADVEDEATGRDPGQVDLQRPLARDGRGVEVAGRAERLGAEELVDPRRAVRARGTSSTGWRGTSSWGGWRSAAAGSSPPPGGGSTSRSSRAACTRGRCRRRRRSRRRRGTGSASRPTSASRSGPPWRSSAGRRASPCSRRRATG